VAGLATAIEEVVAAEIAKLSDAEVEALLAEAANEPNTDKNIGEAE